MDSAFSGIPTRIEVIAIRLLLRQLPVCEGARQKAYAVAKTPQFAEALCKRRKVEALFSERKNMVGPRRIKFVREQSYLAAVAQNLKRLVRFLATRPQLAGACSS